MTITSRTFVMAFFATCALAVAVGQVSAQRQSDQQQSQKEQKENDQQNASQSDSQADQREQQQQQQRQQKQQQQNQDSQQRDQQSRDRDQSSGRDSDSSRDGQWPQPNGQNYGSDSLSYGEQQGRGNQQGGLGVGLRSDGRDGVVVSHVHSNSPAEEMGIRQGDRITAVNGRQIQSVQQFIARIRNMDPGQEIELDIRRARGGNEQTVRGELDSRQEALAGHSRQYQSSDRQRDQRGNQYGQQSRGSWQTSYDDERGSSSQDRSGPMSGNRLDQIERQVNQLSQQLDEIRVALQNIRSDSGQSSQWSNERTARYDEYQGRSSQRDGENRVDGQRTYRDSNPSRDSIDERDDRSDFRRNTGASNQTSRSAGRDSATDTPGGETGEDRLHVGSEDARE